MMMTTKRVLASAVLLLTALLTVMAQTVSVKWTLGDVDNLGQTTVAGEATYTAMLTTSYAQGSNIAKVEALAKSGADEGFTAVTYTPAFACFTPTTRVTSATAGHTLTFTVAPASGHTLKVNRISFDCVKVGTDGGNIEMRAGQKGGTLQSFTTVGIQRNKITADNSTGYAHNEFIISDMVVSSAGLQVVLYMYNVNGTDSDSPKSLGFRNITVEGEVDGKVQNAAYYLSALTCKAKTGSGDAAVTDLYSLVKDLKNGETARYNSKLYAAPTDFAATLQSSLGSGYTANVSYNETGKKATVSISKGSVTVFSFDIIFNVTTQTPKGQAAPLSRGLMAVNLKASGGTGNLVSWRARSGDGRKYKYRLYRGVSATSQTQNVNSGKYIVGKTNFADNTSNATANSYYRLEVYDENNELVESVVSGKTWDNQSLYITLEGGAPTDPTSAKATYKPNDASYCDMDGDGEYEIILKWAPSNERDAASSGLTSPAFYACYKMDGTRLWMLHTGANMFNSAHTTPFVAWDLDGDGFGEFMVKTAPGAIDGQGNYVLLGNDSPTENLKSGRNKQDHGSEYITVYDGMTGAELKTIPYHTAYGDVTTSFWGDSNQNRSERYLAAIAWLDGEDANPSAIFARGYYNGCKIGAYDWDGENITLRWLHTGESATKGTVKYADGTVKNLTKTVYGEGAHWISIGDVTGDGRQEIHYGSGALNADGTTLYRTGLGHGDAIHLGDFIPSRPGQEYFMAHEEKSSNGNYGVDLRDARTGEILVRRTADSDTGRGLMGHFNPEADDAYFFDSADGGKDGDGNFQFDLYDTSGTKVSTIGFGTSGATANARIFWDGDLADETFDKSLICSFNPSTMSFDRVPFNGTAANNYVWGTLNNDSKNNPCVQGDLLGDWREELVTWQQSGSDYQLIINATNLPTNYTFPHLMEDAAYRAQVISQNCGYNQPPHVSYDPRTEKTIVPETFEASKGNTDQTVGKYWGSFFTTYPVIIPEGTIAWSVTGMTANDKTIKVTELTAGKVIAMNRPVVFNSASSAPRFVPTTFDQNANPSITYVKGAYNDEPVTVTSAQSLYEWRNGSRGVGFYRTESSRMVPGGSVYAVFTGTAESLVLNSTYNTLYNAADRLLGDVNGDNVVNVADVTALIGHLKGETPAGFDQTAADVNGDSKVDFADVTAIVSVMLGK